MPLYRGSFSFWKRSDLPFHFFARIVWNPVAKAKFRQNLNGKERKSDERKNAEGRIHCSVLPYQTYNRMLLGKRITFHKTSKNLSTIKSSMAKKHHFHHYFPEVKATQVKLVGCNILSHEYTVLFWLFPLGSVKCYTASLWGKMRVLGIYLFSNYFRSRC